MGVTFQIGPCLAWNSKELQLQPQANLRFVVNCLLLPLKCLIPRVRATVFGFLFVYLFCFLLKQRLITSQPWLSLMLASVSC